ncbi:coiled-coil-helix-coiled-coil-helix domain-containing protein 10, mitochondrial-like [Fagus crenata]
MARRSSSGGRSSSRSSGRSSLGNPPKTVSSAPPPARVQNQSGSIMGAIGASIADGMAWGAGTSIAHRAIDAIMGPRVIKHETVESSETVAASATAAAPAPNTNNIGSSDVCVGQSKALTDCLNDYGSDISKCQFYMDILQQCRQGSGTTLSA